MGVPVTHPRLYPIILLALQRQRPALGVATVIKKELGKTVPLRLPPLAELPAERTFGNS